MRLPRPAVVWYLFVKSSSVQRKRAALTIAAIAWGSLSLLLMLSFGQGLRDSMWRASQGQGSGLAINWPGRTSVNWKGLPTGRPVRPRIDDVDWLQDRLPDMAGVSGEIHRWGTSIEGDNTRTAKINGVHPAYGEMRNQIPRMGGRFLNVLDNERRRRVVFLGDELARDLFGSEECVGRTVKIERVPYTVVGVLIEKVMMGNYGGMDEDQAVIPIRTYEAQFGREALSVLLLKPARDEETELAVRRAREALSPRLGFDPEDPRAFTTWDTYETSSIQRNAMLGIQMFLGIVGALTLAIGGVGVANIMYAVVKQRTREIGVKMALGARPSWITGPIVLEGLTYTVLGGAIGLLMAVGLITLIGAIPTGDDMAVRLMGKPRLSPEIAIGNAVILGVIGILAGWFPARRAARVDPAKTLRYE
jgi:putative ABC transport system permease protein